ncbi:DEAD/DEAH box helicase [Holophaga foetida]|uniref:DEAD/DEAH box helicase n=1 Tax=Holophaga foetida TaxID=35839 RepID=UPI0002474A05|nr:DEAD/DEAH box helicase [Holophaga foetida]
MIRPILQYRPMDRGFVICLPGDADPHAWQRVLRTLPGNLHGRDRLTPARARIFLPDSSLLETHTVPLRWQRALPWLASLPTDGERVGGSLAFWASALRLLQSFVIRGAVLPQLTTTHQPWRATWGISLTSPSDREALDRLVKAIPPSVLAFPEDDMWVFTKGMTLGGLEPEEVDDDLAMPPGADALVRAFLEDGADFLVRFAAGTLRQGEDPRLGLIHRLRGHKRDRLPWDERIMVALSHPMSEFPTVGVTERTLGEQMEQWSEGARIQWIRPSLRLEAPPLPPGKDAIQEADRLSEAGWCLRVGLETQEGDFIPVSRLWEPGTELVAMEARKVLLRGLARAVPFFPALQGALSGQKPEDLKLSPTEAWTFLTRGATQLKEAGFLIHTPEEMAELGGARRLRAKVRLGARSLSESKTAQTQEGLEGSVSADWSLMLGDDQLGLEDFAQMASLKHPLVAWKGKWVALDPETLKQITAVIQASRGAGFESMTRGEALAAALTGTARIPGVSEAIEVEVAGDFGSALAELKNLPDKPITQPREFRGQLRPYQLRGLAWLEGLSRLGLGGILADDMGLGKTIEVLAMLLHRQAQSPQFGPPTLLICPTSLLGNWEREIEKFAPGLPFFVHHGNNREVLPATFIPHTVVLTTYGVIRREEEIFGNRAWGMVVVDEAQAIKNAGSAQAKAVRRIRAPFKLALTGTPIENRLSELWSILAFVLPGYLGSESTFKECFATPIEKYRDPDAAQDLRQRVGPFILRRLKTDRNIIQDLPEKQEMKVYTQLTKEQAALYQTRVEQMDKDLAAVSGIERRGRILALLTHLKQICNHPSHFLRQTGPYKGRSGKLERMTEMLEEVVEIGDRALIFTQFKEMGDRLQVHLKDVLGFEPPFLHGGTTRDQRDEMVRSFQEDADSAPILLLSLKAGGVGLNLTAATHVFHFDRWWNPAVEDQATDRTYRIGQTRNVQVHKLITMGTLEEKIDAILESKRDLADRVVGTGEGWLTELDDDSLRRLVALEPDADIMGDEENGNGNGHALPPHPPAPEPPPVEEPEEEEAEAQEPGKVAKPKAPKAPAKRKPKAPSRKGVIS